MATVNAAFTPCPNYCNYLLFGVVHILWLRIMRFYGNNINSKINLWLSGDTVELYENSEFKSWNLIITVISTCRECTLISRTIWQLTIWFVFCTNVPWKWWFWNTNSFFNLDEIILLVYYRKHIFSTNGMSICKLTLYHKCCR